MKRAQVLAVSVLAAVLTTTGTGGALAAPSADVPVSDAGSSAAVGTVEPWSASSAGVIVNHDITGGGTFLLTSGSSTSRRLGPGPDAGQGDFAVSGDLVMRVVPTASGAAIDWQDLAGVPVGIPYTLTSTATVTRSLVSASPRGVLYVEETTDANGVVHDVLRERRTDGTVASFFEVEGTDSFGDEGAVGNDIYFLRVDPTDGHGTLERVSVDAPRTLVAVSDPDENVVSWSATTGVAGYLTDADTLVRVDRTTGAHTVRALSFEEGESFDLEAGYPPFAITPTGSAWVTQVCPPDTDCAAPRVVSAAADPASPQAVLTDPLECQLECVVLADGSRLLAVRHGDPTSGGLVSFGAGSTTGTLLIPNGQAARAIQAIALSAGQVVYSDNRTVPATLTTRPFSGVNPASLGPESSLGSATIKEFWGGPELTASGKRVAYVHSDSSAFGSSLTVAGAGAPLELGPATNAKISGLRVLYLSDHNGTTKLRDLVTGVTTSLPAGGYDLWGPYLVRLQTDGSVVRQDLRTGAVTTVFTASAAYAWTAGGGAGVAVWGDNVMRQSFTTAQVKNVLTDQLVNLPGFGNADGCDGGFPYQLGDGIALSTHCGIVRLEQLYPAGEIALPAVQFAQVDGTRVAFQGEDGRAYVRDTGMDPHPRLLGAATPATVSSSGWSTEFVFTHEIGTCTLTISSASADVRTLPCTGALGDGTAFWDGKNTAGEALPDGAYTWTVNATTPDGTVIRSNGVSEAAATGTVRIGVPSKVPTFKLGTNIIAAGQQTKVVVTGDPGDSVDVLVRGAASSSYTVLATVHPNSAGVAALVVHPSTNSSYLVRNVVGSAPAQSLTVKAVQSLVVQLSGRTGIFTGHIAPSVVGRTVLVYFYPNGGHVQTACTTKTTAGGQFKCTHAFAAGTYNVFAQTNADKYNAAGRSTLHLLKVS